MPVYIFEPDAFEKIVKVEGEEYQKHRKDIAYDTYSFESFLKEWGRLSQNPNFKDFRPEFGINVKGNGAIYGRGG